MANLNITISNGINNPMYLDRIPMDVDRLDTYYADNQDYVVGWMGIREVRIDVNGRQYAAIYAGTAGNGSNCQDYYFIPNGDAWAMSNRGEANAQIMGHAYLSSIARNGMLYAANFGNN